MALVNYGSEREPFPLPEEARRAKLTMRSRANYEATTGDRSLSEFCTHLRKTWPTGERETDLGAQEQRVYYT